MTKYFVDQAGNCLGGFDGATPPAGSIQVPSPPADGRQKWVNGSWAALVLVPEVLTPPQFFCSLNHFGIRATCDAYVANSGDQDLKDWYARAPSYNRSHPLILKAITDLTAQGFNAALADQVWTYGAAL